MVFFRWKNAGPKVENSRPAHTHAIGKIRAEFENLLGELNLDQAALYIDPLDSAGEGAATHVGIKVCEQILAFQVSKPTIWKRNTKDGKIVEDERRGGGIGLDQEAGLGADRFTTEEWHILVEGRFDPGIDGSFFDFDLNIITEGGVLVEKAIELPLREDEGLFTGLVARFFNSLLDGLMLLMGQGDRTLIGFPPKDCSSGGQTDGKEDQGGDQDGAQKVALG